MWETLIIMIITLSVFEELLSRGSKLFPCWLGCWDWGDIATGGVCDLAKGIVVEAETPGGPIVGPAELAVTGAWLVDAILVSGVNLNGRTGEPNRWPETRFFSKKARRHSVESFTFRFQAFQGFQLQPVVRGPRGRLGTQPAPQHCGCYLSWLFSRLTSAFRADQFASSPFRIILSTPLWQIKHKAHRTNQKILFRFPLSPFLMKTATLSILSYSSFVGFL